MDGRKSGVAVSLLLLLGCELTATLEVDLPESEPVLTVNSFFTPDSTWKVHLSESSGLVDGRSRITDLASARVSIVPQDGGQIVRLRHIGGGFYVASSAFPRIGASYTLDVQAPDYPRVRAEDRVPEPLEARHQYTIHKLFEISALGSQFLTASVTIWLTDVPNQSNYYRLLVLLEPRTVGEVKQLTFTAPYGSVLAENSGPEDLSSNDAGTVLWEAVFSDESFDGQEEELSLDLKGKSVRTCYNEGPADELEGSPCILRVYLLHISENFYQYALTHRLHQSLADDSNAIPVAVSSNIENGFGIFAAYTGYSFEIAVDSVSNPPVRNTD